MKNPLSLALFLALTLGGGLAVGFLSPPGQWYAQLAKPVFTPPGWVFAPAWTVLYVLIAVAGWRLWRLDRHGTLMKLWWVQLIVNFSWSPVFFLGHLVTPALVILLVLLAAVIVLVLRAWHADRAVSWLLVPYAAWVMFATALNAGILVLN